MRKYHRLITDSSRNELFTVIDYSIEGFDLTELWDGTQINTPLPIDVKLLVDSANSTEPDLVGNPISWFICSNRLIKKWLPLIEDDVQLLEAPLYEKSSNKKIDGYKILNPIKLIRALDLEKSKFIGNKEKIKTISKFVLETINIPENVHMFRPKEFPKAIIVSDELAQKILGVGIEGVAFVPCDSI